jgi:DNA-binding NtrC family response regulator
MSSQKLSLRVVHLDDDPFELERVKRALEQHATACTFQVESLSQVDTFRKRLRSRPAPEIVILDIHLNHSQATGVQLAAETRSMLPDAVILMCSTADDVGTIAESLGSGADDFISKHSDHGELSLRVFNSYRLAMLKAGRDPEGSTVATREKISVGASTQRISARIPQILNSAISAVFIRGESGTGKEVVADLFAARLGGNQPFIKVNCGAIAPTLLESELFGHAKGSFTGASADKKGLLEASSGGWIFLDEVATLSLPAQVALLRVLENGEVTRVGTTKPISIQVRVLSATNEPMEELIAAGKFRADLWQRLRETEVYLSPLRERPDEIPALIKHFCNTMPGGPYQASQPTIDVLSHSSWRQGNVRELRNVLRAMTEMHVGKLLTPIAIPARVWEDLGESPVSGSATGEAKKDTQRSGHNLEPKLQHEEDNGSLSQPDRLITVPSKTDLTIPWPDNGSPNFDDLSDTLLVALVQRLVEQGGRLSLRTLAQTIGMSRSTLSGRLKGAVHKNIIPLRDLTVLVGISDL